MIDKTAIINKNAKVHPSVKVGPYSVIGPNVEIGKNACIAAQCGISGSVKIGNNFISGGQSGYAGHITIGNNVIVEPGTPALTEASRPAPTRDQSPPGLAPQIDSFMTSEYDGVAINTAATAVIKCFFILSSLL